MMVHVGRRWFAAKVMVVQRILNDNSWDSPAKYPSKSWDSAQWRRSLLISVVDLA